MMKTHCHPFKPFEPSIVLCIAVIMIPANILPTCPIAVKIAVLLAISEGVLQILVNEPDFMFVCLQRME